MSQTDALFKDYMSAELRKQDARMDSLVEKVTIIEVEQSQTKALLEKNTESIEKLSARTEEMIHVFESWKGAMRALEMIGKLAKPLAAIAAFVGAVIGGYTAWKSGNSL